MSNFINTLLTLILIALVLAIFTGHTPANNAVYAQPLRQPQPVYVVNMQPAIQNPNGQIINAGQPAGWQRAAELAAPQSATVGASFQPVPRPFTAEQAHNGNLVTDAINLCPPNASAAAMAWCLSVSEWKNK